MTAPALIGIDRVARIAATHADAVDREGRFPAEAVAAMREEGLLGQMVPATLGGRGTPLSVVAQQTQVLARACASSAMVFAMHHNQIACVIDHALGDPWHADFARRLAAEQLLVASVTSEVGIGGDMRSSTCAVAVADGRFTLEKAAPTISYARYADAFFVTARAHADAPASDQVLVTVLRADTTLDHTGEWDALGLRGTCSEAFRFVGTGLAAQVMPTSFADIAGATMVPVSHLLWAAAWTGIAVDATARARRFLRERARRTPGVVPPGAARLTQSVGPLQQMRSRLRELLAQYDSARDPAAAAAVPPRDRWPEGMALAVAMNSLKVDVSETCLQVVHNAMVICGMAGYRNGTEYSVGRHLRDIYSAQLMISNDRVVATTGALLLAQRSEIGAL
ncbi:MAG: acyl-CoA/acyl-ACP dehydrogenase [Sphingomonas fennica]